MRIFFSVLFLAGILTACDDTRVYEKNVDLNERYWSLKNRVEFEFDIPENRINYNLYCDIRNTIAYPYSRLFINYYLEDSAGMPLQKKLTQALLFDPKTGKPFGSSGLGDIYDHRIPILNDYHLPYSGKYKIKFEQFMRTDTLQGILAVGLRVEKNLAK